MTRLPNLEKQMIFLSLNLLFPKKHQTFLLKKSDLSQHGCPNLEPSFFFKKRVVQNLQNKDEQRFSFNG